MLVSHIVHITKIYRE